MNQQPPPLPEDLLAHLTARRDTAQAEVDRLTAELADAREFLTRLDITRQTLLDLLGPATPPPEPSPADPPLPPAYTDILTVPAQHPDGLHPKDVCLAIDLSSTSKNTVEGIRAKLKRLVGRDLATEPEKGLFILKPPET